MPRQILLPPPWPTSDIQLPKIKGKSKRGTQTYVTAASVEEDHHTRLSKEIIYESPKFEPVREDVDDDDYDDEFLEEDANKFGTENEDSVDTPYLMPYVYKTRFIDTE